MADATKGAVLTAFAARWIRPTYPIAREMGRCMSSVCKRTAEPLGVAPLQDLGITGWIAPAAIDASDATF
jgi:hypothetical protein